MADTAQKTLGITFKIDQAALKSQLEEVKKTIQDLFTGGLSLDFLKSAVQETKSSADEMKSILKDLRAYQRDQDNQLTNEEIAMAKRVAQEQVAAAKEAQQQMEAIRKANLATFYAGVQDQAKVLNTTPGVMGMDPGVRQNMANYYSDLAQKAQTFADRQKKVNETVTEGRQSLLHLNEGLVGYAQGLLNLLAIQARWYGAKAVLKIAWDIPVDFIKSGYEYIKLIDDFNASFLKWDATGGQVTPKMREDVKALTDQMQKTILTVPVSFDDLGKAIEAFKSHGVPTETIKGMTDALGILTSNFKEIDIKQFSVSLLGLFNVFKGELPGLTDAEKLTNIIQMMLKAQAEGVMRPEQFSKVAQYMGEMGHVAGLSIPQILAMSVAISDTGVQATVASRLLSTFIQRISQVKAQQELLKLGIQIQPDKDFASQMDKIFGTLKERLTSGGSASMGAIGFINQIAGSQGAKVLIPLIENLDKVNTLATKIAGSGGSLQAINSVKADSIAGQWQLFANTMQTVAKDVTYADGLMKGIVTTFLEMGRGILYAIDPTVATADAMAKLGVAGRTTYDITKELAPLFRSLSSDTKTLGSILLEAVEFLAKFHDVILLLAMGSLVKYLLGLSAVSTALTSFKMMMQTIMALDIETMWMRAGMAMDAMRVSVNALLTPMNVLTGVLTIAIYGWMKYKEALDDAKHSGDQFLQNVQASNATMDTKGALAGRAVWLQQQLQQLQDARAKLAAAFENAPGPATGRAELELTKYDSQIKATQKALDATDQAVKDWDKNHPAAPQPTTPPPLPGPDVKSYYGTYLAATKEYYKALLDEQKSYSDEAMKLTEDFYKVGLVDNAEYFAMKRKNLTDNYQIEIDLMLEEISQIQKDYDKGMAGVKEGPNKGEQVKALTEKRAADMETVNAKYIKAMSGYTSGQLGISTDEMLKNRSIMADELNVQLNLTKTYLSSTLNDTLTSYKIQAMYTKDLYDKGGMSATAYYQALVDDAQNNNEAQKVFLTEEYEATKKNRDEIMALAATTPEQRRQILNQQREDDAKYQADIQKANQDTAEKIVQYQLQAANDIKAIYEQLGAGGAIDKALTDLSNEYNNTGKNLYDMTTNMAHGMENALTTFLDGSSSDFLNFKKLIQNIFNSISQSFAQMVSKMLMSQLLGNGQGGSAGGGIMGFLGSIFRGSYSVTDLSPGSASGMGVMDSVYSGLAGVFHRGGVVGSGSTQMRPIMLTKEMLDSLPRYHSGNDEFLSVLQKGEMVIPKGYSNTPPAPEVHYHYYINAIDTKSFADTVKRNPGAIVDVTNRNLKGNGVLRGTVRKVGR
jgi:TP901 family phage tail tape measure protein